MTDNMEINELNPTLNYEYAYGFKDVNILSAADTVKKLREKVAPLRFRIAARSISRELNLNGGEKVLEIGSGLGLLGKEIKEEVDGSIDYFGVELAFNPSRESKENQIDPLQANALKLPFAEGTFDAVVSTDVMEHIADAGSAIDEIGRVLRPGGKAFIVIADPSEARFENVEGHINRSGENTDIPYWEEKFEKSGLVILKDNSEKYRNKDWRKIFNLPFLTKIKDKPGFACAFNPINRPGTYIAEKPS